MKYSGSISSFYLMPKDLQKAIEFRATVESLAYVISKVKNKSGKEIPTEAKFNWICEKILENNLLKEQVLSHYKKEGVEFMPSNTKKLFIISSASNLALEWDTKNLK